MMFFFFVTPNILINIMEKPLNKKYKIMKKILLIGLVSVLLWGCRERVLEDDLTEKGNVMYYESVNVSFHLTEPVEQVGLGGAQLFIKNGVVVK